MRTVFILFTWAVCCVAEEPSSVAGVRDGSSYDKAVIIEGSMRKSLELEWKWITLHYPGARGPSEPKTSVDGQSRRFAAITFTTQDGTPKTVYFDISGVK